MSNHYNSFNDTLSKIETLLGEKPKNTNTYNKPQQIEVIEDLKPLNQNNNAIEIVEITTTKPIQSKPLEVIEVKTDYSNNNPYANQGDDLKSLINEVKAIVNPLATLTGLSKSASNIKHSFKKIQAGDIIGVSRGVYEHYGIYVGKNKVVHYTSSDSDVSLNNVIQETSIDRFLRDATEYFSIDFDSFNKGMKNYSFVDDFFETFLGADLSKVEGLEYKVLKPEETIKRAYDMIGQGNYNLLSNNCEHMAMWCKVGVRECNQLLNRKYRIYYKR